jgi:hypothetical protein
LPPLLLLAALFSLSISLSIAISLSLSLSFSLSLDMFYRCPFAARGANELRRRSKQ